MPQLRVSRTADNLDASALFGGSGRSACRRGLRLRSVHACRPAPHVVVLFRRFLQRQRQAPPSSCCCCCWSTSGVAISNSRQTSPGTQRSRLTPFSPCCCCHADDGVPWSQELSLSYGCWCHEERLFFQRRVLRCRRAAILVGRS